MPTLCDPVGLAGRTAPSRVVFGPHETNLGRGRTISERHVAYYRARAAGGAGVVVTEVASVHPSDWPYERCPAAWEAGPGWTAVADAVHAHGGLALAGLGHAGAQGSSAYSQAVLVAPSRVADAVSREQPAALEPEEIAELVAAFARAAREAVVSGMDGVVLDAGPRALLRQFHSGLTNLRDDAYGTDRLRATREVLDAVRAELGPERVLGLRLSCDELAPWAGVTPEEAAVQVDVLAPSLDLLTVVRGGPFSVGAERPGAHTPPMFNVELCGAMRAAVAGRCLVALQGSVVDPADADTALADGTCDLVEMTRAQIADPRLVSLVRAGRSGDLRPCVRCNQTCQVRDPRNPLVTCIGQPRSGHETTDPDVDGPPTDGGPPGGSPRSVVVVGAGVAGLECARVLAGHGHRVRVVDRADRPGGLVPTVAVGPGRTSLAELAGWLLGSCERAGVAFDLGHEVDPDDLGPLVDGTDAVVLATGGRPAAPPFPDDGSAPVVDVATVLAGSPDDLPGGPVAVLDPVGGPVAVGAAEWLAGAGRDVALVCPDPVAGTLLAITGDLADANARLQRAGVTRHLRSRVVALEGGAVVVEDVWTGEPTRIPAAVVVDAGHRLPDDRLGRHRPDLPAAGDGVAPRTIAEAVREGRQRAVELEDRWTTGPAGSTRRRT